MEAQEKALECKIEQLSRNLSKEFLPCYLVSGAEVQQVNDGADTICKSAYTKGYTSRYFFLVDKGFCWDALFNTIENQSMFTEDKLIDILCLGNIADARQGKVLLRMLQIGQGKVAFVIRCARISNCLAWVKFVERTGCHVRVFEKKGKALVAWLKNELAERKLTTTESALQALAVQIRGDMVCAAQHIEKLEMMFAPGYLEDAKLLSSLENSGSCDVFDFALEAVAGRVSVAVQMLAELRRRLTPLPMVLWALARNIRFLVDASGRSVPCGFRKVYSRSGRAKIAWETLLCRCQEIDVASKGCHLDDGWNLMFSLVCCIGAEQRRVLPATG